MGTHNIEEYNQEYICTVIQFFLALLQHHTLIFQCLSATAAYL